MTSYLDAERVGLVLGSNGGHDLSVACLNKLRQLALASGKTAYTIVVGEPTPQKLANFPEIDIFVLVGSPEVSILPSKGFYKPVIHPWEFMMATTGNEWDGSFNADWSQIINQNIKINLKGLQSYTLLYILWRSSPQKRPLRGLTNTSMGRFAASPSYMLGGPA